jgi:hypothetical protein
MLNLICGDRIEMFYEDSPTTTDSRNSWPFADGSG